MVQQLSDEQKRERWARLTAHAWEDPAFKQQLLSNPKPALAEAGLEVPENFDVRIVEAGSAEAGEVGVYTITEESPGVYSLTMRLAEKPTGVSGELSESELDAVAGGTSVSSCCCTCTPCCSC
jgi:hypothetical protein